MGEILITFVKQSSAYKLLKTSNREGISARIVQAPKELSRGGCSYGVVMKRADMSRAVAICREYSIEYRRIFSVYYDINGKKVYREV